MRKFQLVIGNKNEKDPQLIIDYSPSNPQGCQVQFNIQQSNAGNTVNAEITVCNISPYYFTMNQNLFGKPVWLYAGMADSPLLRKIGYSGTYGLIAQGYISRVIPEWNGSTSVISITFQPFLINNTGNNTPYELYVQAGQDIRQKYKNIYKLIGGDIQTLNMGNAPIKCIQSYTGLVYTVADMSVLLQNQHGLTLQQTSNGFIISSIIGKTIKLVPGDFLMQPSLVDFRRISITLMMRSDIQMGDIVTLPPEIYVGITALDSNANGGYVTDSSEFQKKTIFSLFHGSYFITDVWQLGDSRNTEAQAWATIIQGNMQ